jgi:hypothetical protein
MPSYEKRIEAMQYYYTLPEREPEPRIKFKSKFEKPIQIVKKTGSIIDIQA